jgi:DNA-directed RNA polymerase specialized sigma24 family protein
LRQIRGDQPAVWEELHRTMYPHLLAMAMKRYRSGPSDPRVEDLIQVVWLKAWKGRTGFEGGADDVETVKVFRGWLETITHREYLRLVQNEGRKGRSVPIDLALADGSSDPRIVNHPVAHDESPSRILGAKEEAEQLLASLPQEDRTVIEDDLKDRQGAGPAEGQPDRRRQRRQRFRDVLKKLRRLWR